MEAQARHSRPWPDPEPRDLAIPAGMQRERFHAMGTTISLLVPRDGASRAFAAVHALFTRWETTLSRFRPHSELSALNARAGEAVAVSPLLYDVVAVALEAARATDGLFDPTLLQQVITLGYDRSFETLPSCSTPALSVAGPGGGWRDIQLDPVRRCVTLPAGSGLDLGGIAKGMAVDAALADLRAQGIEVALVNAGGDLAVNGLPPGATSWPIAVPTRDGTYTVTLHHGAVATSSSARRRWRQGGQERHHLLDPRTGLPTQGDVRSATVGADRCVQAEVAAKVACVLGPVNGARVLRDRGLSGLLVRENGEAQAIGAWPTPPSPRSMMHDPAEGDDIRAVRSMER